jgi:catechol-2,3-dioxygenase
MLIDQIELLCADLEKVERFYSENLELQVHKKEKDSVSFAAGSSIITFKLSQEKEPVYHFAFNIPANLIAEGLDWLRQRAEIISTDSGSVIDFPNWNARSVYFYDTLGNVLELIARFDLDVRENPPFSPDHLLCVSEIGVATHDVPALTDNLIKGCGLSLYHRQPRLDNFTALGDEHGLIIVSKAGRHWYPTETESAPYYTALKFCDDGKKQNIVFNGDSPGRGT